jgi:ubiquinone/menaquinone biosynthesis C-methylase UbiE
MPVFDYYTKNKQDGEQFGRAMQSVSGFASHAVLEAYDFGGLKTIMDVGGGNGSMVLGILGRYPSAKGVVVDLPYIGDLAHATIRAANLSDRCRFEPVDFFQALPKGADAHLMKFILHDWNDEECTRILKASRAAIEPGGRLIVLEVVVPEEEAQPHFSHLMDLNMLVMTGGMERTAKEYEKLFASAGYALNRIVPTASPFSVIEARPV